MAGSGLRSVASGPLQVAKWEESPGIEHHETLLRFTLENSTKGLSITGRGRGLREALTGASLSPFPSFLSPGQCEVGGGRLSLSSCAPPLGVTLRDPAASNFEATQGKESEKRQGGEQGTKRQMGEDREACIQREVETRKEIKMHLRTQRWGSRGAGEAEGKGPVDKWKGQWLHRKARERDRWLSKTQGEPNQAERKLQQKDPVKVES